MKLTESLKDYDSNMALAIQAMIEDQLGMEVSEVEAREMVNNMGLSDVLGLDQALDKNDTDAVRDIVAKFMGNKNA